MMAALAAKVYRAAKQDNSNLHAMSILQVQQTKALKAMHEGSSEPGFMQGLCTVTDLTLRVTKVSAWALSQTMSSQVIQR